MNSYVKALLIVLLTPPAAHLLACDYRFVIYFASGVAVATIHQMPDRWQPLPAPWKATAQKDGTR